MKGEKWSLRIIGIITIVLMFFHIRWYGGIAQMFSLQSIIDGFTIFGFSIGIESVVRILLGLSMLLAGITCIIVGSKKISRVANLIYLIFSLALLGLAFYNTYLLEGFEVWKFLQYNIILVLFAAIQGILLFVFARKKI